MSQWESYRNKCLTDGLKNPYKNEEAFNRAYNIAPKVEETRIHIVPKPKPFNIPCIKSSNKAKSNSARTRKVISSEEEREINRTRWMREQREKWKAQGLTCRGTPYKIKPQAVQ